MTETQQNFVDVKVRDGHYVGVDLDRTLAYYHDGDWAKYGVGVIGPPIPNAVNQVKYWLGKGINVWIFTARVHPFGITEQMQAMVQKKIEDWCLKHIGRVLPVTCSKHPLMEIIWDDRAVHVAPNSGVFTLPENYWVVENIHEIHS